MIQVLVSVDDRADSLKAVRHALHRFQNGEPLHVHLLQVRPPRPAGAARFWGGRSRAARRRERAARTLAAASRMLERSAVPYAVHVEPGGEPALVVHDAARRLRADQILIGTSRGEMVARMRRDAASDRLRDIRHVPVGTITVEWAPLFERIGVPLGIGTGLALLYLAASE